MRPEEINKEVANVIANGKNWKGVLIGAVSVFAIYGIGKLGVKAGKKIFKNHKFINVPMDTTGTKPDSEESEK